MKSRCLPPRAWMVVLAAIVGASLPLMVSCWPVPKCLVCGQFQQVGAFADPRIRECSGLVASEKNPGILWMHNDSGDTARIFALTEGGELRGVYTLEGASARDWEDMAHGPCASGAGTDCLYIGDIGDNAAQRDGIQIYRVEEPDVPFDGPAVEEVLGSVERFDCSYPDGPHNAETLVVDPTAGIPYVVTKDAAGATAVYYFPSAPLDGGSVTLDKLTVLDGRAILTGGDASPDGSRVILRDYFGAYEYLRPAGGAFSDVFLAAPCEITLAQEAQGEAIAVAPSGTEIFTASEGEAAPIHKAECQLGE